MYNQLKNHFGIEFLKKEIFDGTHIAKTRQYTQTSHVLCLLTDFLTDLV